MTRQSGRARGPLGTCSEDRIEREIIADGTGNQPDKGCRRHKFIDLTRGFVSAASTKP